MGDGIGLNLSKSGISSSIRTKYGSFGSTGFSIRSGIPGLYYRKYNKKNDNEFFVMILLIIISFALGILLLKLIVWLITEFNKLIRRKLIEKNIRHELRIKLEENEYLSFSPNIFNSIGKNSNAEIIHQFHKEGDLILSGQQICLVKSKKDVFCLYSGIDGIIDYHVNKFSKFHQGDIICSVIPSDHG